MYQEEWIEFWSKYAKNKKFWNITLRSHLKRFTFSSVLWNWPLTSWTSFFSSEFCAFPRRELRGSRHCSDSHPGKLGKLVFARFANSMIASLILSYEIWGGGQKTSVWFCQRFGVPRSQGEGLSVTPKTRLPPPPLPLILASCRIWPIKALIYVTRDILTKVRKQFWEWKC